MHMAPKWCCDRPKSTPSAIRPAAAGVCEPVMFLRLKSPRTHGAGLLQELARRRVRILEHDIRRDELVVRAEVRLADALGLAAAAARLTNGAAALWTWLSRYDAAWLPPPDARR